MGLAKAAELNHYPGPKHVLELAKPLALSEDQRARTQAAFDAMHQQATELGTRIVEQERLLDALFKDGHIDAAHLESSVAELGRLQGTLRLAHLSAHLQMKEILTPEQIHEYVALRGYQSDGAEPAHHHAGHH